MLKALLRTGSTGRDPRKTRIGRNYWQFLAMLDLVGVPVLAQHLAVVVSSVTQIPGFVGAPTMFPAILALAISQTRTTSYPRRAYRADSPHQF
jgi:hypothetical protein